MSLPTRSRPHCLPPAPHVRPCFDLLALLEDPIALPLWRIVRNAIVWAHAPAEHRKRFLPAYPEILDEYREAERAIPELRLPLRVFAEFQENPEGSDVEELARSLHAVYGWAEKHGKLAVAAHFAEAAAYVDPEHPAFAVDAGWVCRRAQIGGNFARSIEWYDRAFKLAVRHRSRHDSLRARTGYGALMQETGNLRRAEQAYIKAARRAARTGRRRSAAVAYHYLFALAAEHGKSETAVEHAQRAFRYYPLHDRRFPYLAHDYASFLLVRFGAFAPALHLARRVLPKLEEPAALTMAAGTLAWAAGGAGFSDQFTAAERLALELTPLYEENAASALVAVALGAWELDERAKVFRYASMALPLAENRGDEWARQRAAILLASVEADGEKRVPPPEPPNSRTLAVSRRIAARLLRWRRRDRPEGPSDKMF